MPCGGRRWLIWETSVPASRFFREPKTALKNIKSLKKKNTLTVQGHLDYLICAGTCSYLISILGDLRKPGARSRKGPAYSRGDLVHLTVGPPRSFDQMCPTGICGASRVSSCASLSFRPAGPTVLQCSLTHMLGDALSQ